LPSADAGGRWDPYIHTQPRRVPGGGVGGGPRGWPGG
jgi:hypothetical protein